MLVESRMISAKKAALRENYIGTQWHPRVIWKIAREYVKSKSRQPNSLLGSFNYANSI
jgi:hypothetical protein